MHEIHVYQIIQPLQENHHDTCTSERNRHDLRPNVNAGIRSPCEPEEADGQKHAAQEHRDKALFGNDAPMTAHSRGEAVFGSKDDDEGADADATEE